MAKLKLTDEDKLWAMRIKERDGFVCVVCGKDKPLNAHHIIPREIHATKYDLMNGITLCSKHHFFSRCISAHNSPVSLAAWLIINRPEQWQYILNKIKELKLLTEEYHND